MRFPLLKVGQKFLYQEQRYCKTGPMTASHEESGKPCMIRRSAEVTLLDDHGERRQTIPDQFSRDQVLSLLQAYKSELKTGLNDAFGATGSLSPAEVLQIVEEHDVRAVFAQLNLSEVS
ncbi:MAG: hypothetical protein P8163_14930 [Candidatus Thiodiazotropha sp.]